MLQYINASINIMTMNIETTLIEALTILAYMVIFVVALGLAEIAVNIVQSIVSSIRRIARPRMG